MKTITLTVSDDLADKIREGAEIFEYPTDDLGQFVESFGGHVFDQLMDEDCQWMREEAISRYWDNEPECRRVAARIAERSGCPGGFSVSYEDRPSSGTGWVIRFARLKEIEEAAV